jgi:flagellar protein FliS
MFGSTQKGINAYAQVGLETGVAAASPHKLIVMLFEGAMIAVTSAIQYMKAGNISSKGQAISRAISIIESGLRASLNKEAGGEIAQNLDALYEYMSRRLLQANIKNQPELLEEVHRLLKDLKEAWEAIGTDVVQIAQPAQSAPQNVNAPANVSAYDALAPSTSRLVKA